MALCHLPGHIDQTGFKKSPAVVKLSEKALILAMPELLRTLAHIPPHDPLLSPTMKTHEDTLGLMVVGSVHGWRLTSVRLALATPTRQ
jgi:hypothetical protein